MLNMFIGRVHTRVPIVGTCSLPSVYAKKELSLGKLGTVKLLDQNYA